MSRWIVSETRRVEVEADDRQRAMDAGLARIRQPDIMGTVDCQQVTERETELPPSFHEDLYPGG